jgi:outer membrane protein assembly factor BamB
MRRAAIVVAALLVVLALGVGGAFVVHRKEQARDVRGSSTVEFVPQQLAPTRPTEPGVSWPTYGHDPERLRFANGVELAPPFKRVWMFRAQSLVEFPPVIAYGRLFFANNAGVLYAISAKTGKRAWKRATNRCQAASPAVNRRLVYFALLNRPPCNAKKVRDGELVALYAGSGRVRWRKRIGPSESSPVVVDGRVFVGDWTGRVYAFSANTGKLRWSYQTGGRVKGALTFSGGRIYVGSYDHHVYALNEKTGKVVWKAGAQQRLGHRGEFYSTPAAAYGRVYIGSTDGKVYSFGAATGKLRWSQSTGGYVYASPAVWRQRVYVGSYSGRFFCFDAATGDVKWKFNANGPISGSPTVLAGRVYFSTLKRRTYSLDARTGRVVWTFPDGKYSPVVADLTRMYLVGYTRLYGLDEKRKAAPLRPITTAQLLAILHRAGFARARLGHVRPLPGATQVVQGVFAARYRTIEAAKAAPPLAGGTRVCNVVVAAPRGARRKLARVVAALRTACVPTRRAAAAPAR